MCEWVSRTVPCLHEFGIRGCGLPSEMGLLGTYSSTPSRFSPFYVSMVCNEWVPFYFACRDEHRLLSFPLLAWRRFYLC